jgi:ribonucleotide reductase alpha subunit
MPTASTSQILGNTESFEPLTNNFYLRRTSAGEFYVVNRYLKDILMGMGSNDWNQANIESILLHKGSIQHLDDIPISIREVFKTVWELSPKDLIDSARDRQCFIDQSQSFNIYLNQPSTTLLNKIHFYAWKQKLKTGSYYIRSKAAISSQPIALSTTDCISCSS